MPEEHTGLLPDWRARFFPLSAPFAQCQCANKPTADLIRDGKFKVTTQIQGDAVRVNGKSRDELQAVIAAVRVNEFPVAVQFVNFRD